MDPAQIAELVEIRDAAAALTERLERIADTPGPRPSAYPLDPTEWPRRAVARVAARFDGGTILLDALIGAAA